MSCELSNSKNGVKILGLEGLEYKWTVEIK